MASRMAELVTVGLLGAYLVAHLVNRSSAQADGGRRVVSCKES